MSGSTATGGSPAAPPAFRNYQVTGSWPERPVAIGQRPGSLTYRKLTVHDRFLADSCAIGDYDGDGHPDVSSGRRWYSGPDFELEHVFRGGHDDLPRDGLGPEVVTGVSDDHADYAVDMDGDGDADIINISYAEADESKTPNPAPTPQVHATAYWYENPGLEASLPERQWEPHLVHADVRHEQHGLVDVNGDGKPEIFGACKGCSPERTLGYYYSDSSDPTLPWRFRSVSGEVEFPYNGMGILHGLGFGLVDEDDVPDLLEPRGVWLSTLQGKAASGPCPAAGCGFTEAPFALATTDGRGGAQMFAADLDGDGDGDVVSAEWAHGIGISWFEQRAPGVFEKWRFVGGPNEAAMYGGVGFSQPHAMELVDMDGDGVPDVITGKQRFAHPNGYGDPDAYGLPVVYVFRTSRQQPSALGGPISFRPALVDSQVGVGRQIGVGHLNTDGVMDLCVATRFGLFVFLGE